MAASLEPGTTTVDMKVRIDHLQPSPIGATVVAEALLQKIEGRRLTFTVSASDDRGLVAVGQLVRVVVDVGQFMAKCGTPADDGSPAPGRTRSRRGVGHRSQSQRCGPC